ncbi:MAG: tetratricopeptide repeat protein, partial [Chloroflexota bacterium]|nr:tetratricopeptide repeat protein [Chloroflexota bacterium]
MAQTLTLAQSEQTVVTPAPFAMPEAWPTPEARDRLKEQGWDKKARAFLKLMLTIPPDAYEARDWLGIARLWASLEEWEKALWAYEEGIKRFPTLRKDAAVQRERADVLARLGRYQEALQAYDEAIALKRKFPEAWFNKGNVLVHLKRYQEALQA